MEPRAQRTAKPTTTVDSRASLAMWLRGGRAQRRLSIEDVARITKIQLRILEKLEAGSHDGLPADVFVRGFVRSFARCVGLDETEALARLGACRDDAPQAARAFVETMLPAVVEIAVAVVPVPVPVPVVAIPLPTIEMPVIEVVAAGSERVAVPEKKKRARKKSATPGAPRTRKKKGAGAEVVVAGEPVVESAAVTESAAVSESDPVTGSVSDPVTGSVSDPVTDSGSDPVSVSVSASDPVSVPDPIPVPVPISDPDPLPEPATTADSAGTWQPTMPPIVTERVAPWRRTATTTLVPSLVIDDADPDRAEREQEERAAASEPQRVSFLPPILLDREDRSARQGGLTLAVIILLIAATLTLSYLMRRPSVVGDGVTMADSSAMLA